MVAFRLASIVGEGTAAFLFFTTTPFNAFFAATFLLPATTSGVLPFADEEVDLVEDGAMGIGDMFTRADFCANVFLAATALGDTGAGRKQEKLYRARTV